MILENQKHHDPPRAMTTRYFSIHIPRCGGTTFNQILARIFKDGFLRVYDDHTPIHTQKEFLELISKNPGIACFSGHNLSYSTSIVPFTQFRFLTFVREPFARCVSLYAYERMKRLEKGIDTGVKFEDWLDMKLSSDYDFSNLQSSKILGQYNPKIEFPEIKKILDDFFFVGITERYDESLILLKHNLNLTYGDFFYQMKNVIGFGRTGCIDPAIKKKFVDRNETDYRVYDYAQARLDASMKKSSINFVSEANEFQVANIENLSNALETANDQIRSVLGKAAREKKELEQLCKKKDEEKRQLMDLYRKNQEDSEKRLAKIRSLQQRLELLKSEMKRTKRNAIRSAAAALKKRVVAFFDRGSRGHSES